LPEGEEIRRFVAGQSGVRALAYSIDGSTLASGGDDQSVRLWSMPEGVPAGRLVGHEAAVWSVAYHPSRALLCSGAQNGEVILWDVETKSPLTHLLAGGDWVTSVEFSPDGRRLAAMSERLSLWDTSLLPDRPSAIIRDTPVELAKVRFQAGSEAKVLYAMIPGRLIRYGVDSEGDLGQVWSNAELGRFTHCFAPDPKGRFVAVGAWEGYVILCDADSGKEVRRWRAADRHILGVAFSLDGRLFASGSIGGEIRVWSVPDFDEVTRLSQRLASCGAVAFDPGGTVFAAAELYSGDLRWWDIASGEPIGHVVTGRGSGNSICFSPSGKWLAMGTANGPVTRRRMPSGESGGVLEGAYGKAVDVTISPDERIIGAACSNGALLLWDATTGERLRFARPLSLTDVLSVDFSSDGRYLGVVRRGGVVELLDSEYPAAPVEDRK
jgi:WD40 repeat protein